MIFSKGTPLSPAAVARNLLRNKQLSVTSRPQQGGVQRLSPQKQGGGQQRPSPQGGQRPPQPLKQSITWKYRQLAENQYTADIRKVGSKVALLQNLMTHFKSQKGGLVEEL